MEALSPEAYQCAMKLNNMATFEWDLRQDTLKYDDMMYYTSLQLLSRIIPTLDHVVKYA